MMVSTVGCDKDCVNYLILFGGHLYFYYMIGPVPILMIDHIYTLAIVIGLIIIMIDPILIFTRPTVTTIYILTTVIDTNIH